MSPRLGPMKSTMGEYLVVSIVMGKPQNGWLIRKNLAKMDDLGGTRISGNLHFTKTGGLPSHGGTPNHILGFSSINHPAIGEPPLMESTICSMIINEY